MANKVLVFIEQRNGQIKKASLEASKAGSDIASKFGCETVAVAIGNEISDLSNIGNYGINKVVHFKNTNLENYSSSAYGDIVADYAKETGADILVFGNTALGKDLAPKVAVKLDAGIAMDCISIDLSGDDIIAMRPVYAGKALINVKIKSANKVFTIRPNVYKVGELSGNNAEVETKEVSELNLNAKVIELKKSEGKLDVAEAEVIVSGGRGLKTPENFNLVEELADSLGAAVGASRAVVDAGWRPHNEQVGQTGKTVSPTLYVALGISGAIQHLAGMRSSKYIVAVNKDKDAPIFQIADYGIAGDVFEVVPALIDEIKKVKE
ncbi:MAG: electron transfer flavoprotein subunit alpha/FixB family protein [Ignavibacteria bacterium]|jgi:electron transfer flavoprotein alpha subunit